jgi:GntR family transcriptional regulator
LSLEEGAEVLEVGRVILTEGHPAAYLVDILPASLLSKADLEPDFSGSVLDVLLRQKKSTALHSSRCEISATTATPEIAHALGIQRGDVLLSFVAYLYDLEGRVVDYSFSYFLPGYFRFHVVRRVGALE